MPRRRAARPPELVPCPDCRWLLEAGNNPKGVAWHECRPVVEIAALELLASEAALDEGRLKEVLSRLLLSAVLSGDGAKIGQLGVALKALGGDGRERRGRASSPELEAWGAGPRAS